MLILFKGDVFLSDNIICKEKNKYCNKSYSEYYYYFRIDNIKKAKDIYNKCYEALYYNENIREILFSDDSYDDELIFIRFRTDFNYIADKIITGTEIEEKKQFKKYIHTLMVIANNTIVFFKKITVKNSSKISKSKKFPFDGKQFTLEEIIGKYTNVPNLINPDDFSIVATHIASKFIINSSLLLAPAFIFFNQDAINITNIILSGFLIMLFFALFILRIKLEKYFKLIDTEIKINSKNRNLVYQPFNHKKTMKNFIQIDIIPLE